MENRPILLFDVLGTLVYDPFYVEVPAFLELSFDELLAQKHPTAWADFERAAITEDELFARFFRDGRAFDHAGLKACMVESYRWLDGMEELLAELAHAGHAIHALSNYPSWYRSIEERLELSRYLSWSFVSCDTGLRKPAALAYTNALSSLAAPAGTCLFIDDREVNCEAARGCGLTAVRFEGAHGLRSALAEQDFI